MEEKKSNSKVIGIIIFVVIIVIAVAYKFFDDNKQDLLPKNLSRVEVKGYLGGEKVAFIKNEEVKKILRKKYRITLDATKAGSIEMVKGSHFHQGDFIWPGSQVALELFKMMYPNRSVKADSIFKSPIVLYSWDQVTEALIKLDIVKKVKNSYYIVDFPKLIQLVNEKKKWSDIGLSMLFGKISVVSTDPSKSNSGNMFSGLLANIFHKDVVGDESIDQYLPQIKEFFSRLGYLDHSSGNLFDQYLTTGMGAKPIIVGYESQIIGYSIQNPGIWEKAKKRVRVLYPEPTVWSEHPLIALNDKGKRLIEALKDKEIQDIAWKEYGFRTGIGGIFNNPGDLKVEGIPDTITKVVPMPNPNVMDKIIEVIQTH